jgi:hypothetical protein
MASKANTKGRKGQSKATAKGQSKATAKSGKSGASGKSASKATKRPAATAKRGGAKEGQGRLDEAMSKVVSVVKKRGDTLRSLPGLEVYNVRPGYFFKNNRITSEPAVVVVIHPRDKELGKRLVPKRLGGVPVQLRMASPTEQIRRVMPEADFASDADAEAGLATPGWDMMQGDDEGTEADPGFASDDPGPSKLVSYEPPPGGTLLDVTEAMKVTCHVSPEQGWRELSRFFQSARKKRLTIAMYDFTAPHVLAELASGRAEGNGKLSLILDPGVSKNGQVKANDVWEEEVRDTLTDSLSNRFSFLWAAVKRKGKVTRSIFPTSYHIKVAVSDGKAFWLSSGNWQSSNQPDVDALDLSLAKLHTRYNREWHVVVEHPGLASTFEAFIKQDMKQARSLQAEAQGDEFGAAGEEEAAVAAAAAAELLIPAEALSDFEADAPKRREFPARTFTFTAEKPLHVRQVLTPDNYAEAVIPVIKKAKKKLYFQNQYIKVTEDAGEKFTGLLDALLRKVADGLEDVRIILRQLPNAADELEALQYYAWRNFQIEDLSFVRHQPGCHTKGIIVDSKVVVVGSHNWSNLGVSRNRDASLIFYDADIARYYEEIFLHDFEVLARPQVLSDEEMPVAVVTTGGGESDSTAADSAATAPDITPAPWDLFEDVS